VANRTQAAMAAVGMGMGPGKRLMAENMAPGDRLSG